MTVRDMQMSAFSLRAYALGLVGFMLIKVLAPGFFARQDMTSPVRFGIIAMGANMLMNLLFVVPLHYWTNIGHVGLALATSLAAYINAALLLFGLRRDGILKKFDAPSSFFVRLSGALVFMIVAVSHFNMGAMENKGLNIFNSKFVLADYETATDIDLGNIESIVAHEYFHNWTGNRITCRDWFQLTLKEGLTVFRDQEFSADMNQKGVKRIEDVLLLRSIQFPEDAGSNSHAIRPENYIEINNFYTPTVYEKGAEVIRMIFNYLGENLYRKGMNVYFESYDGKAVTCENFIDALTKGSKSDLTIFKKWYSQAGTPTLSIKREIENTGLKFNMSQKINGEKSHLPIPIKLSCLNKKGNFIKFKLQKFSIIFFPNPSILKASLDTKCFNFSIDIFSQ
mgnify:CR=1 FL=1